ncbi:MAG TPA: 16S rRNA processing protein RimM [Prevotellaceae bacterium]|nr:16S rRNA processing protein RimM [Prevotellaceae bacterium]
MIRDEEVYRIGQLTRTHGVKGEVALSFTDDVWDRAEADYLVLRVDGILVPFFLEEYRFRSDTVALVKFEGYDTAGQVSALCGCEVFFPHSLTPVSPDRAEYTWRYFTGFRLIDEERGPLGAIEHVEDSTRNVLFLVDGRMIPAAADLVTDIDHKGRTITMRLPAGLLDL